MPQIVISGLGWLLPAQTAPAVLILPKIATNLSPSLRQGRTAAMQTLLRYRLIIDAMRAFTARLAQRAIPIPKALFHAPPVAGADGG